MTKHVERAGLGLVGAVVARRVTGLQAQLLRPGGPNSAAVAALARLRRAAGKPPGTVLEALQYTVADEFITADEAVTDRREQAAHLAMTLYALHQQARSQPMHVPGRGVGTALRGLHTGPVDQVPTPLGRRLAMLGTANHVDELSHHLRGVVQLLRAGAVPLDYGRLGDDLDRWQRDPNPVQLRWGRDFYRTPSHDGNPASPARPE